MKNIVYLLIILLPITACRKGIGIPEEYSFLKGTWYCSECVYDSLQIEEHRIIFTSNKLRPNVIYFDEIELNHFSLSTWDVLLILNKRVIKHDSFMVKSIDENTDTLLSYFRSNSNGYYPEIYVKK